jgi:hypothetical protein
MRLFDFFQRPGEVPVTATFTGAPASGMVGPAWADSSGQAEVVRNPLRVQNHVARLVVAYVPGVTAVTPHARYFGLHPWAATVAAERGYDDAQTAELFRRIEVVVAWASGHHDDHHAELPGAHGADAIARHVHGGILDVDAAQASYSPNRFGFFDSAYTSPERQLGTMSSSGGPGARFDAVARDGIETNLVGLLDAAYQGTLDETLGRDGAEAGWCVCGARTGGEGTWLREVLCARRGGPAQMIAADKTRRDTMRLLARALKHHSGASSASQAAADRPEGAEASDGGLSDKAVNAFRHALCFDGDLGESPVVASDVIEFGEAWRGLLLRHYTVTAWRRLWTATVNTVDGRGLTTAQIGEMVAGACPDITVGEYAASFTTTDTDRLLPAEMGAWADPGPGGDVGVLLISGRRVDEVSEKARGSLCGRTDRDELGPMWLAGQLETAANRPLRDWVSEVCANLLVRAQRVGLAKFRISRIDGRAIVPAQVQERDGMWRKMYEVGPTPLVLRVGQLATVCAGAGLFDHHGGKWSVTAAGEELLG